MSHKTVVMNVSSFGRDFPEIVTFLKEKVGPVEFVRFDANAKAEELAEATKGATYIILGTWPTLDAKFFELNTTVKLVARHGLGYNNVDIKAAKEHGVFVTKEYKINEQDAVAEQAAALLLESAKRLDISNEKVHDGTWLKDRGRMMGLQVRGRTTGIIGFGNIGRRFGDIMKHGFNNRLLAYDPFVEEKEVNYYGAEKVSLDYLLANSDFISLHCNLTEDNHELINKDAIAKMKDGALLVNCARGRLVDENAIAEAIKSGKLFGYAADVFVNEPVNEDNPLLKLDHVVASPHSGVYNLTCTRMMNDKVIQDIMLMEEGKRPNEIVNGL